MAWWLRSQTTYYDVKWNHCITVELGMEDSNATFFERKGKGIVIYPADYTKAALWMETQPRLRSFMVGGCVVTWWLEPAVRSVVMMAADAQIRTMPVETGRKVLSPSAQDPDKEEFDRLYNGFYVRDLSKVRAELTVEPEVAPVTAEWFRVEKQFTPSEHGSTATLPRPKQAKSTLA